MDIQTEAVPGRLRFETILDMISACDLSIHDISRVQLDPNSGLPRFNMPLELGADLALHMRGPRSHRQRRILVLDGTAHRYDLTLSDISGMDIAIHHDRPDTVIRMVRDWLNATSAASHPLPGARALIGDHELFLRRAPAIAVELRLDSPDEMDHRDYLYVVEQALARIEADRIATKG